MARLATSRHAERHRSDRIGWLRAAVLGANDGIVSTSSLLVGVAASSASRTSILVAGIAGLAGGAGSMAAGEYVSVSSQADTEKADLAKETRELEDDPAGELAELAFIYEQRGLDPDLALQVAEQLTANDALGAHSRDELGISHVVTARPLQAAWSSAASFAVGALLPLIVAAVVPKDWATVALVLTALVALAGLGFVGARLGGAPPARAVVRITLWSALAMAVTFAIGRVVGTAI